MSPNVPELCRTWACVRANGEHITARELALVFIFAVACGIVVGWPEPRR